MQANKFIDGVPKFSKRGSILDSCPTCFRAKMTKATRPKGTTKKATIPNQGISIDFAFSGTKSKNSKRQIDFEGFSGKTAWCLISDHVTSRYYGVCERTKALPLKWLSNWIQKHKPDCKGKCIYMDQGGELARNPKVVALFKDAGYHVNPTGSDGLFQNEPAERGHRFISDGIRDFASWRQS